MKICYVWIEEYRNFRNMSINLSSNEKFKYDKDLNILSKVDVNYKLPEDFFGKSITDITGIIGKNGAGKSNAIELICKILKGSKTSLSNENFLLVTEEEGKFNCYYSSKYFDNITSDFDIIFDEYEGNINNFKVVFFSNVFDERKNNFSQDISDISVNTSLQRNINYRQNKQTNFQKQIKFINSKIFKNLEITTPKKILFISNIWSIRQSSMSEKHFYKENYDLMKEFKIFYRNRLRDISINNKFMYLVIYSFFIKVIKSNYRHYENDEYLTYILKTSMETHRSTDSVSIEMIKYIREMMRIDSNYIDKNKVITFIDNLKDFSKNYILEHNTEGSRDKSFEYFIFDYNQNKDFLADAVEILQDNSFFDIEWLGISSGHKAYLNLFASLYTELKYSKLGNLLLCIDEGDLYLHPKWQVEFFNRLLNILPEIYNGKIQLILTSHSPFLLSDLPNPNITILDNNESINGVDLEINTFGGNLYDLYSKPFFLENKRTSEFAFNKIEELIKRINKKSLTKKDKEEIKQINNFLGDEIIQYKIHKVLKDD